MEQKTSPPLLVILGVGITLAAGVGFLLLSLVRGPGEPAPTITPVPVAQLPTAMLTATPIPTFAIETPGTSPIPTPVPEASPPLPVIPEVAPDFTLEQAGGDMFTLSEQLAQGPVVLVFIHSGGG